MLFTREEKNSLKNFEKKLGYTFKKKELLQRALTHKSYANEQKWPATAHNERLEFLGDAVMELVVSHLLMFTFASHSEGKLSKWRAAIVNEEKLAELAHQISLGKFLFLGKGEEQTKGREKPSLLSDAYEAVLGAIYLDRGFKKVFSVIQKHFEPLLSQVGEEGYAKDYKTRLQELVQSRFRVTPNYKLENATGPDHQKIFEVSLSIRGKIYASGKGGNKKAAEQMAAKNALEKLLEEKSP